VFLASFLVAGLIFRRARQEALAESCVVSETVAPATQMIDVVGDTVSNRTQDSWWSRLWRPRGPSIADVVERLAIAERMDGLNPRARNDGAWWNAATGVGTTRDKNAWVGFNRYELPPEFCRELWRGDALVAKIIERPVRDAFRQGYRVLTGDKELDKDIHALFEDLNLDEQLLRAANYARALGGGAVLLGLDDGEDLSQPLRPGQASELRFTQAFDATEMTVLRGDWNMDPYTPHYARPNVYQVRILQGGLIPVHRSRLVIFNGIFTSNVQHRQRSGWGDSVVQRLYHEVANYQQFWGAVAALVSDANQGVLTIPGLQDMLARDASGALNERLALMDTTRSILRSIVLAKDETFARVATSFAGLPELLDRAGTRLSAVADFPVTVLLGISPAGLNATGDSDTRHYYDQVAAYRIAELRPRILYVAELAAHILTVGQYEGDMKLEFNPLWQLTEKEQAEMRAQQAQVDEIYLDHGVLLPEEVRQSRFGGEDGWSHHTQLFPQLTDPVMLAQLRARAGSTITGPDKHPQFSQTTATTNTAKLSSPMRLKPRARPLPGAPAGADVPSWGAYPTW